MITLNFKYHYCMEYCLRTHSYLTIDGTGMWEIDEIDLAEEFCTSPYDFLNFIEDYIFNNLEIEYEDIEFDEDVLKQLQDFCEQYKKEL